MAKKHTSRLSPKDIAPHAAQWSREELLKARAILDGLLDAAAGESKLETETPPQMTAASPEKGKRGGGYFEIKLINGYGPYKYLRYWSEGKRKSVYVGPVESAE